MSDLDDRPAGPGTAGDRAARRAWVVAGGGGGTLGVALAAISAAAGASGRSGFGFFLLGLLAGTAAGALWALVAAIRVSLRGEPVGRRLGVATAMLALATIVLPVMLIGGGG